ncbi:MAG: methyltransferase domain-containing protein [Pseudomonadota bacterium]
MSDTYLDKVYDARTASETRDLYDSWSQTYDAEVGQNGYATPKRCADALARHVEDRAQPILDFGCGTGLSGLALAGAGFSTIDGCDLSADMLKGAADKGIYRHLKQVEAGEAPSTTPGAHAVICAIGVIGAGAAPIDTFDMLMGCLASGGLLVLSFNDHALEDPKNEDRLHEWITARKAKYLFLEYGPHLPGINLKSNVYILEKA